MNTLSRQPQLALSGPFERMRDFRDSLGIDDVNLSLSTVSDQTRVSDRRRVGIVYNPETARVSGEPAQIFDRFIPPRFQSASRNIVAALKHAPSRPIRTANDPEFSMSHKAAGYELECFKARAFASVNAAMSSDVSPSDLGSIGCCRSSKKRAKSSASCCKRRQRLNSFEALFSHAHSSKLSLLLGHVTTIVPISPESIICALGR